MGQDSSDFKLFKDIWAILGGAKTAGVSVENLLYLLLIIRGAKIPFKEREFDAEEDGSQQDENLQTSNEKVPDVLSNNCMMSLTGEFVVRPGGQTKIYKHFKDLYINRMQFEGIKKPVKSVELQFVQSKPQISKKSQKMAEKAREKVR